MASDKAFEEAEKKIEQALRRGATELDLGYDYGAEDSEKLSELPQTLAQLTQLQTLNLLGNELTVLPEWLGQLTQLESLDLSGNQLTALPEALSQLTHLQTLSLSYNQLTVLPESLGQLSRLRTLDLSGNQLTALPESLGQLTQLQTLHLRESQLSALPASLGQLTQLQALYLLGNQLTTLPESLGQLRQLQTLDVYGNHLTALPASLGQLTQLQALSLSYNQLTVLPESLGQLTQLQSLDLSRNQLTALPESLGQLTQLQSLDLSDNELTALPESLGQLTQLETLRLSHNQLTALPESLGRLTQLHQLSVGYNLVETLPQSLVHLAQLRELELRDNPLGKVPESLKALIDLEVLYLHDCRLNEVPDWIGEFRALKTLGLGGNQLTEIPDSIAQLRQLATLFLGYDNGDGNPVAQLPDCLHHLENLETLIAAHCEITDLPGWLLDLEKLDDLGLYGNPLNPELAAAYELGLHAVKAYLRAKAEDQIVLNEAKLILIGEGEVGKTSLLGALRDDAWVENRATTRGVEVDIKSLVLKDAESRTEITFNAWDFGGQDIYKHTHQLFFTAPAVYLAVWDPRGGPEKCRVDDWIKLVKHRAYDENRPDERPRILVVATRGGPTDRLAHIDEQAIRDEFGDLIVGFYHVDSRPDDETGERVGIERLKDVIAKTAVSIPQVGREVPKSWKDMLEAVRKRGKRDPHITFKQFQALCRRQKVSNDLSNTYISILNELGHLIHYRGDSDLRETVILKPEYLGKAISCVLEDALTKEHNGLLQHDRLPEIWNNPNRPKRERYPENLHPVFLKLMQRFDLSYQVVMPEAGAPPTSLVAQLVPGGRPENWERDWRPELEPGDSERTQICRIVDAETGKTAEPEGLLYRLIVRLHRYSLGRNNYFDSRHWKTGLILDDDFNGRAFVEELGGDIHVTVRAAYPERFLTHLCSEIEWLVDHFWKGLDCRHSVPCHRRCKGLHEVKALIATKREGISKVRCSVCEKFYDIDSLLATVTPKPPIEQALTDLKNGQQEIMQGVSAVGADLRRLISQADEQFDLLMTTLTDPAKDGPRLFSFAPVKPNWRRWFNPKNWTAEEFRLSLWCEHRRLPLPVLYGDGTKGVYTLRLTRDWVRRAAPALKVLSTTLSLALPVAASAAKLVLDQAVFDSIEDQLNFGKTLAESSLKGGEKVADWLSTDDETTRRETETIRAQGSVLRELHGMLKDLDKHSTFGGLERVQNKRREFLWVHPQYVSEY